MTLQIKLKNKMSNKISIQKRETDNVMEKIWFE